MTLAGPRRANTARANPTSNVGNNSVPCVFANYRPEFCAYGNTVAGFMRDIQEAQRLGVDGFFLDFEGWGYTGAAAGWTDLTIITSHIFLAAKRLGTGFQLAFDHEMQPYGYGAAAFAAAANMLLGYANHPNYFKLQGRPVMVAYNGSANPAAGSADAIYYTAVMAAVTAAGFNVFYIPTFDSNTLTPPSPADLPTYTAGLNSWFSTSSWLPAVADGILAWNWYVPPKYNEYNSAYSAMCATQNIYFAASVCPMLSQLRLISLGTATAIQSLEFYGGEGLASVWGDIIGTLQPLMVHIATWNDLTESYVAPYPVSDMTVNNKTFWQITFDYLNSHAGYAELNKYYIQWYKSRAQPVWPDAMYVFYRNGAQALVPSAKPAGQSISWNQQGVAPTLDDLYITTILTAPATLTVTTGGTPVVSTPGAGVTHTRVPFATGAQTFVLVRSAVTLISITGANVVASETQYYNVNPVSYFGYH